MLRPEPTGGEVQPVTHRQLGAPPSQQALVHGELSEHDWHVVASWNPEWSLTDVLADYDACDLFARYLVENGAGRGTYHAALFGYCFLNDVRYLDADAARGRLAIQAMFDAACRHLAASFEQFTAEVLAARLALVTRQPVTVAVHAGPARWLAELPDAAQLHGLLAGCGLTGKLDDALTGVFLARDRHTTLAATGLGSLSVAHEPAGFRLTARLDEDAVAAGNAATVRRLHGGGTSRYLQLDDLVVLYPAEPAADPLVAVLLLCCRARYGDGRPGTVDCDRGRLVVVHPPGPDQAAVRALLAAHHPAATITLRPL